MNSETSTSRERLNWVDLVKGVCILLVVSVHVTNKHFIGLGGPAAAVTFWDTLGRSLNPIRMPLFFFVSGLLVASSFGRTWSSSLEKRVFRPYYLYMVWLGLSFLIYRLLDSDIDGSGASQFPNVLAGLVYPLSSLWYLYALAAYYLLARLLSYVPRHAALAVALTLAVASSLWPVNVQTSVAGNFLFFCVGAFFAEEAKSIARTASFARAGLAAVLYMLVLGVYVFEIDRVPGVRPVTSAIAVWVGVVTLSLMAKYRPVSRPLAYIGRQTLSIYVLHLPLLAVVDRFARVDVSEPGLGTLLLAFVYPLILVALIVGLSILLERSMRRAGLAALFSMPEFTRVRHGIRRALR